MKINIKGGGSGSGYGNYVLRENRDLSPEEFEKIKVLSGDMSFGDEIVNSSNYKDNAFNIILEFKGKISDTKSKQITDDFEELFMHGFEKDEYHFDAVLHQDTDNTHVHIRIPKKNLYTDTTLRLYIDSQDRERLNTMREHLEYKYNLEKMSDNLRLQPQQESEIIQKWRAERGKNPFDFSKKKGRDKTQNYIANYVVEVHQAGLIEDIEDVKDLLKGLDLDFVKSGHDFKTDTRYLTFENETGKLALRGELFDEQFYKEFTREDRSQQIRDNQSTRRDKQELKRDAREVHEALERGLNQRYKAVTKRYETPRARASSKYQKLSLFLRKGSRGTGQRAQEILTNYYRGFDGLFTMSGLGVKTSESRNLDSTREEPIHKAEQKIYRHRRVRNSVIKRQKNILYPDRPRGIDGTARKTDTDKQEDTSRGRPERTSSYERFRVSREILYTQTRTAMQDRANARGKRERLGKKIDKIGGECEGLERTISKQYKQLSGESENIIQSVEDLTRAIKKEMNSQQHPEDKMNTCVAIDPSGMDFLNPYSRR